MFCKNCGRELENGSAFCPYCGANQGETGASQGVNTNGFQSYNYVPYGPTGAAQNDIEETKTLGIVAIIVGIFMPIVGFICGGIGLSKIKKLNAVAFEEQKPQLNKNKKLCIAGIVVPAVLTVISIIVSIVIGVAVGTRIAKDVADNYDNGNYSYSFDSDDIDDNLEEYFEQYGIDIDD